MDLDEQNDVDEIHAANMAGTWQAIVNGFAGVRCQNGVLKFKPTIPKEWEEYAFRLKFKGALLEVRITKDEAEFTLFPDTAPLRIHYRPPARFLPCWRHGFPRRSCCGNHRDPFLQTVRNIYMLHPDADVTCHDSENTGGQRRMMQGNFLIEVVVSTDFFFGKEIVMQVHAKDRY